MSVLNARMISRFNCMTGLTSRHSYEGWVTTSKYYFCGKQQTDLEKANTEHFLGFLVVFSMMNLSKISDHQSCFSHHSDLHHHIQLQSLVLPAGNIELSGSLNLQLSPSTITMGNILQLFYKSFRLYNCNACFR